MNIDLRKIYQFTPVELSAGQESLPTGGDFFYECADCKVVLSSVPYIKCACKCGNLTGGAGKMTVKDAAKVAVMRGKLK